MDHSACGPSAEGNPVVSAEGAFTDAAGVNLPARVLW